MKNNIKQLILILMVLVFVVGCSSNSKSALKEIQDKKTFVIGTSPDYPPFEFVISEDGKTKVVGADIELAKLVAKDLNVNLEIKEMKFDALIPALQAGKIDAIITGMSPNEKRRKNVDFTDIYFVGKNAVVVLEGKDVKDVEKLKTLKLGVQKSTTQETFLKDVLKVENYKALPTTQDLILDLKLGRIDAVIMNDKVSEINVNRNKGLAIAKNLNLDQGEAEEMAIAIKKGQNKDLLERLNKLIKKIKDDNTFAKILTDSVDLITKEIK